MTAHDLPPKWPVIDALAASMGAKKEARAKWRVRGIPYKWMVRLIGESHGNLKVQDFNMPSDKRVAS